MTEHDYALFGVAMSIVIGLVLVAALIIVAIDRFKEWTRSRERKWKMERLLDECNADLTRLEKRATVLEARVAVVEAVLEAKEAGDG